GAQEAGGIAGGKELFGVGARPARAAHLPGGRKPDIDLAVIGLRMPILAAAGGGGAGGIENFHDRSPIVLRTQSGRVTQWGRGRFALPPTLAAGTGPFSPFSAALQMPFCRALGWPGFSSYRNFPSAGRHRS